MTIKNIEQIRKVLLIYNLAMLDENLYTTYPRNGVLTCDDVNYNPDKARIKDILWENYPWLLKVNKAGLLRPSILDNIQRTLLCNTIYLGYDGFECPACGNEMLFFHKCHSRFCTSCGVKYQKKLAAEAEAMCVDTPHRHIVFTIPEAYRIYFRRERQALNLLFVAARNTIAKVTNEKIYRKEKKKRGQTGHLHNDKDNYYLYRNFKDANIFGMIASIHTFGRDLKWNPHIHALVPELIYDPAKDEIRHFHHFDFKNLRLTWQYELNRLMSDYFKDSFTKDKDYSFKKQTKGFYVYAKYQKDDDKSDKSYSKNIAGCVSYMMRYASRPPMAENRIISHDKASQSVRWFYDDHKTEERIEVRESSRSLLKKMIIHIPDEGFRCVRYYGFYNNKKRKTLERIYELMGKEVQASRDKMLRKKQLNDKLKKIRYRTSVCDEFNRDVLRCKCGSLLQYVDSYNPLEGVRNDRQYRTKCINEMYALWIRRKRPSPGINKNQGNLRT